MFSNASTSFENWYVCSHSIYNYTIYYIITQPYYVMCTHVPHISAMHMFYLTE